MFATGFTNRILRPSGDQTLGNRCMVQQIEHDDSEGQQGQGNSEELAADALGLSRRYLRRRGSFGKSIADGAKVKIEVAGGRVAVLGVGGEEAVYDVVERIRILRRGLESGEEDSAEGQLIILRGAGGEWILAQDFDAAVAGQHDGARREVAMHSARSVASGQILRNVNGDIEETAAGDGAGLHDGFERLAIESVVRTGAGPSNDVGVVWCEARHSSYIDY
jgi:hypothetical protein